ncbi:MAG: ACP S-malonyltransferase, partial [Verrucomicrobiota bacterium]
MSSVVLLFSGQGAQEVGMGKALAEASPTAASVLEEADEILGWSLSSVMFDGPEEALTLTSRCQPALYTQGQMLLAALREEAPDLKIAASAGLSLGEFTAHAAAETFSFSDGLRLVARRGELMEEACAAGDGAMAAMIGGDEENVKQLATDSGVDVANFNAPGQIVLSGSREGIGKAIENAKASGVRIAKELKVAGAYHSRLMQSAADELGTALESCPMQTPAFPVISNVEATGVSEPDQIRAALKAQVT